MGFIVELVAEFVIWLFVELLFDAFIRPVFGALWGATFGRLFPPRNDAKMLDELAKERRGRRGARSRSQT